MPWLSLWTVKEFRLFSTRREEPVPGADPGTYLPLFSLDEFKTYQTAETDVDLVLVQ
jgi:hypothetical protein